MQYDDVNQVVIYDREVIGHTLGKDTILNELSENPFAHYFVMEDETTHVFLGMISLWIDSPKAQIINIYVLPKYQSLGFGSVLFDFFLDYVKSYEVDEVTLEVRPSNLKAIHLYEKYGFTQVSIRRNYYDNGEDAYLMLKRM
jgi:ribosomal-protein-alanine N-acetyltransferase